MSCTSCSTSSNGKPGGCQSNGGCSTGGCNLMNTHDWLRNLPMSDFASACKVIEVTFNQGTRKDFFRNPDRLYYLTLLNKLFQDVASFQKHFFLRYKCQQYSLLIRLDLPLL